MGKQKERGETMRALSILMMIVLVIQALGFFYGALSIIYGDLSTKIIGLCMVLIAINAWSVFILQETIKKASRGGYI